MKTIYIFLAILCLACLPVHPQMDKPLRQPAFLGGIDSASKNFIRMENANRHKSKAYEDQDRLHGTLIEDPRVIFSTYLGGNGYDCGNSLSVTQDSGVYVVGYTGSTNFPVSDDAVQKEKKGGHDMFVGKFTKTGERVWLTYLGGNGTDVATECVTDKDDNLILVGKTNSVDFPTTDGVEQKEFQGSVDVVIVKFDPTGKIIWSRYYGGSSGEIGDGIALCANKYDFVITGSTLSDWVKDSKGLPVTPGCYQDSLAKFAYPEHSGSDAFVSKFTGDGKLVWGTYFGGGEVDAAHAVAVDKDDNIAIVGETQHHGYYKAPRFPVTPDAFMKDTCALEDIFYAKFNPNGNLLYSTLYCGKSVKKGDEGPYPRPSDFVYDIKFDNNDNAIFVGSTLSRIFPVTENSYKSTYEIGDYGLSEGCIVIFDKHNNRIYSTFCGGYDGDEIYSIATTKENDFWISGYTMSTNFNFSEDALFKKTYGGASNFITKFSSKGFPIWSTAYSAGFCYKIDVLNDSNLYITGEQMWSIDFPITKKAFQNNADPSGNYDGYLVHFNLPIMSSHIDTTDTNKATSFLIFPNPVKDVINILLPKTSTISIIIYDFLGKELSNYSFIEEKDHIIIVVSHLLPGCYGFTIQFENKTVRKMFLKL